MLAQIISPLGFLLLLPFSIAAPSTTRSLALPIVPATNTCTPGTGTPGAFYMCRESNFAGGCEHIPANNVCMTWPEGNPGVKVRSFGPDIGGVCDFYKEASCKGGVVRRLECPGLSDMGDRGWFGSVRCRVKFELSGEAGVRG